MGNIKNVFRNYLLNFSSKAFNDIINNLEIYKLILHFLKRNGIESFNFSRDEFAYRIFLVLKEYRESLIVILEDETMNESQFISKISNLILKDLNRNLYKTRKAEAREVKNPELVSALPYIESDKLEERENFKDLKTRKKDIIKIINKERSFRYREALKCYFGLERPYALSFNMINKIFKIKRSTFYLKLKNIKETRNES